MSAKNSKPKPDDKEQSARFIETAKQIENPDAIKYFKEALGNIVKKKQPIKNQSSLSTQDK
jgi:hypothetical protein